MYEVQVAKGHRKYRTMLKTNQRNQAIAHYNGYNVHSGGKKRLLVEGEVFHRVIT